jgi:hypothetical protein
MNSIKMPKLVNAVCDLCGYNDDVVWGQYGSETYCSVCNAAPINFTKVAA